jgi:hypothetical protein
MGDGNWDFGGHQPLLPTNSWPDIRLHSCLKVPRKQLDQDVTNDRKESINCRLGERGVGVPR